jgi:hypothetical protein
MKKLITLFAIAGLVLALAPAAQAQTIIAGVTATAGSEYDPGWGPDYVRSATKAVDGTGILSGEGATGLHTGNDTATGWFNGGSATDWFKVDLGASYNVGKMYVWNGECGNGTWDRGVNPADIYYSTVATTDPIPTGGASSGDWILITAAQAFNQKPLDTANYGPTDTFDLDVTARAIGLYCSQGFAGNAGCSFAELQFEEGSGGGPVATPGTLIYGK